MVIEPVHCGSSSILKVLFLGHPVGLYIKCVPNLIENFKLQLNYALSLPSCPASTTRATAPTSALMESPTVLTAILETCATQALKRLHGLPWTLEITPKYLWKRFFSTTGWATRKLVPGPGTLRFGFLTSYQHLEQPCSLGVIC